MRGVGFTLNVGRAVLLDEVYFPVALSHFTSPRGFFCLFSQADTVVAGRAVFFAISRGEMPTLPAPAMTALMIEVIGFRGERFFGAGFIELQDVLKNSGLFQLVAELLKEAGCVYVIHNMLIGYCADDMDILPLYVEERNISLGMNCRAESFQGVLFKGGVALHLINNTMHQCLVTHI